jgi:hypothetical protein
LAGWVVLVLVLAAAGCGCGSSADLLAHCGTRGVVQSGWCADWLAVAGCGCSAEWGNFPYHYTQQTARLLPTVFALPPPHGHYLHSVHRQPS